jgi:DnaJ like chaperone protein
MLARLAKADGRICEKEIAQVESFIADDLQLNSESRQIAINIFRTAAESQDSFIGYAEQFFFQFQMQPRFLELMLDILLRVSLADGDFSAQEEQLILQAVSVFKVPAEQYLRIKAKYIGDTDKYHAILGCDKTDSDEFIKKQYRKLVTEYHPDKIASKGLPEEFSVFAAEKFREIQEAYEIVKKERGLK